MKRFISVSMAITFITLILFMPVGCKFNTKEFPITGIWKMEIDLKWTGEFLAQKIED